MSRRITRALQRTADGTTVTLHRSADAAPLGSWAVPVVCQRLLQPTGRFRRRSLSLVVRHYMKLKTLLLLSLALTLWPVISQSAEHRRQIVSVDFKVKNGPDGLGSLFVSDQTTITVQVPVEGRLQSPPGTVDARPRPDVAKLGLQVWLLRADGTVVPQKDADRGASAVGGVGVENWFVMFHFAKVPLAEITGIVFLKEGKLYCQQIAATDWKVL
jgi:hypothetical protein